MRRKALRHPLFVLFKCLNHKNGSLRGRVKNESASEFGKNNETGFTLIEVLFAMSIMVIAFVGMISIEEKSVKATEKARDMNIVAMLAKNLMLETELKIQGKEFTAIRPEEEGDFKSPYEKYHWKVTMKEVKFPDLSSLGLGGQRPQGAGADANQRASSNTQGGIDALTLTLMQGITQTFAKATRVVRVEVSWKNLNQVQTFSLATFWVNFDFILNFPGF